MTRTTVILITLTLLAIMSLSWPSLGKVPDGVVPVEGFDINRYLGKWYEIARMDHRFERGLSNVSAHYSLRDDGKIRVINRGFNTKKDKWKEAKGKAKFADKKTSGYLKVSFFGPFYISYVIADLDDDYQYALVTGANHDYLWILAREPELPDATLKALLKKAEASGFDTQELIYVEHDR